MSAPRDDIGLVAIEAYLPHFVLTAKEIARSSRTAPGKPLQRRLAGFDEDSLTMAVAAARKMDDETLSVATNVLFSSASAPYSAKNNASAAVASLGLASDVSAYDAGGSYRSGIGAVLGASPDTLVLLGDVNTTRPGGANELTHGDGAAAVLVGPLVDAIATVEQTVSSTGEFLDQWRTPGQAWTSASEDRFSASRYPAMLSDVLLRSDIGSADHIIISSPSPRATAAARKLLQRLGSVHRSSDTGYLGAADVFVQLADVLANANPGDTILAFNLSDGCDMVRLVCTEALVRRRPKPLPAPLDNQVPTYLDALSWRGLLNREPPRRPEPSVVSAAASSRSAQWKFAMRGSQCGNCHAISSPPQDVCPRCASRDHLETVDLSRRPATIQTFSVDRLAYSPNPPMVAAVVDFEGGGRLEVEITDPRVDELRVGQRIRMTFRRRHSSGGVHNYAWKAIQEEEANV